MRSFNTQVIISQNKMYYNSFMIVCGGIFNMELNYTLIGTRIKRIRKSQKLTQERLSEMARCRKNTREQLIGLFRALYIWIILISLL